MKKPNIVWLMSDQHNANCLGIAGHHAVRTPNLDRVAADGVHFTRAYCNNPICGPSRSSFLTGQYVGTHGISGNFIREVRSQAPNIARVFKENGYDTALIGKAHLPYQWVEEGFDTIKLSDLCDAEYDNPASCDYFNDLIQAGLADRYDQGCLPPGHPGYGNCAFISELPEEYSLEAWTGRKAVEFLNSRNRERPFLLKVSFQRPHDPYAPPSSRANDYDASSLSLPANACDGLDCSFSGKPQFQQDYVRGPKGKGYPYLPCDADDLKKQMAAYFTLITMIDDAIGDVLKKLEDQGELDNTIVVYTADHGDFAGEHGLMLKNLGIYESIHRIPFIIAGPGIPKGIICDTIIESVDLYPTLAELAGIPCEPGIDGTSRTAEMQTGKGGCAATVCEWDFPPPQERVHAVRDSDFRMVFYDSNPNDGELYDLRQDPGELTNLFNHTDYQTEQTRLIKHMESFRSATRRIHTQQMDAGFVAKVKDKSSIQIHRYFAKWSDIHSKIQQE